MKVLFLVDCYSEIGAGHLVRCLAIADALKQSGKAECMFLSHITDKNFRLMMMRSAHQLFECEQAIGSSNYSECITSTLAEINPDFIVVDDYQLSDSTQHKILTQYPWMLIDDWPHRKSSASILLDSTYLRVAKEYHSLAKPEAKILTGEKYVPLRHQFSQTPASVPAGTGLAKILIFMGATDPNGDCLKIAKILEETTFEITVLTSLSSPGYQELEGLVRNRKHWNLLSFCEDMHQLLLDHDLVIGAPGSNTWERCATATPAITICQDKNQEALGSAVASSGAAVHLGYFSNKTAEELMNALEWVDKNIHDMSCAARKMCDGQGTNRIAQQILNYSTPLTANNYGIS